jgi:hypothetical protein
MRQPTARGRTTFLITHDLHQVASADQILYLEDQRIMDSSLSSNCSAPAANCAALQRWQEVCASAGRRQLTKARRRADGWKPPSRCHQPEPVRETEMTRVERAAWAELR